MKRKLLLEERITFECEIPPNKDKEILKQQLEPEKGEFDTPVNFQSHINIDLSPLNNTIMNTHTRMLREEERYRQNLHESTIHRIDTLRSIRPETEREYYRDQTEQERRILIAEQERRILIAERDNLRAQVEILQNQIVEHFQRSSVPSYILYKESSQNSEDTIDETTPKI